MGVGRGDSERESRHAGEKCKVVTFFIYVYVRILSKTKSLNVI